MAGNKIANRLSRPYIATKLYEEGMMSKEICNEFLKKDNVTIDDIISGKILIDFGMNR